MAEAKGVAGPAGVSAGDPNLAAGADEEIRAANQREFGGALGFVAAALCIAYTVFHIGILNLYPLETWTYRLIHIGGGLVLGFLFFASYGLSPGAAVRRRGLVELAGLALAGIGVAYGFGAMAWIWIDWAMNGTLRPDARLLESFGPALAAGSSLALLLSWTFPHRSVDRVNPADLLLALASIAVVLYLVFFRAQLQMRAGMPMATSGDMWAAIIGVGLILELTRRLAGLALVVIAGLFIAYAFLGPWLPGVLEHRGYQVKRFFTYIFTDTGVLGAPVAISSTYIILFITFAAFLQASRVGEYFVNFSFAVAGGARGGPAKVAVFGSALMGTINGTSAGNVVSTGSLTIPLMKKVGYRPQTAASVEAAASSGGQILPPIMGAGAFIMAEITEIPYTDIVIAAIIPALLYFVSVYFMVDLEAVKKGMRGLPRSELPEFRRLARQAFLFLPIVILIAALYMGYSVIRAGTLAMAAAAVVSWLTPHRMGPRAILHALELAARMSLQLVAVCAAAGVIVGVIALTGIGTRFSALLLGLADQNQMLALLFAMVVSILLGMGMPTTAAYVVAASVLAPGLENMGIDKLTAHFFIFYYAVMSAITPPVALAAYAGAAIARSDPMRTSVESFKIGLAAFVVPFMFFSAPALLMQGEGLDILRVALTACVGIFLLAAAVQGWFLGRAALWLRGVMLVGALGMIAGGWLSDVIGLVILAAAWVAQKHLLGPQDIARGAD